MRWGDLPPGTVFTEIMADGATRTWTVTDARSLAGEPLDEEHMLLMHVGPWTEGVVPIVGTKDVQIPLGPSYDGDGKLFVRNRYLTYPPPTIEEDPL